MKSHKQLANQHVEFPSRAMGEEWGRLDLVLTGPPYSKPIARHIVRASCERTHNVDNAQRSGQTTIP